MHADLIELTRLASALYREALTMLDTGDHEGAAERVEQARYIQTLIEEIQ